MRCVQGKGKQMKLKAIHIGRNIKGEIKERKVTIIAILIDAASSPIAVYIDENGKLNDDFIYKFKVLEGL